MFFANILLVSNYSQSVISEREFLIFTKNYEKQNNTNVNTKILFSKFWLRKVLGKVYLPSLIRSTALDYNKYSSNYNELLFIRHLTNTLKIESISSNDLTNHINNYDTNENVILNRKWLNESYFFKRSDNNEILKELCGHLKFDYDTVFANAICIPCRMLYITSMFMPRKKGDRPLSVPKNSKNLAFVSQFVEIPGDVVFTVEYSIRAAQMAFYEFLDIDLEIPPIIPYDKNFKVKMKTIIKSFN